MKINKFFKKSGIGIVILFLAGVSIAYAALTFSGTTISGDGSVTMDSANTISIGTSTATGITIGKVGQTTTFPGTVISGSIALTPSTVTPGSYTNTNLTVDANGRITSASNGNAITALTGDVTATGPGSVAASVAKINGTSLAGLATGILKNTTGTGIPSIASYGDLPKGNPLAGVTVSLPFGGFSNIALTNATFPRVGCYDCALGDTDLYTVPTGRKALVFDVLTTNKYIQGGGIVQCLDEYKVGGVYTKYDYCGQNIVSGQLIYTSNLYTRVFTEGTTFAVNLTSGGTAVPTVWVMVVEFDATVPVYTEEVTSFGAGTDTTIFSMTGNSPYAPVLNKSTATMLLNGVGTGKGILFYFNNTGATRTLSAYWVPSGGSSGLDNMILGGATGGGTTCLDVSAKTVTIYGNLAAGESLQINSDSAAVGQYAGVTYVLLPN